MKKENKLNILFLTIISIFSTNLIAQIPEGYDPVPVWEDNFDGSSLDTTKWKLLTGDLTSICSGSGGHRHWKHENVDMGTYHGESSLRIRTDWDSSNQYFTNGGVESNKRYETRYGYFEARIKLHTVKGLRTSFWLQTYPGVAEVGNEGNDGSEIDIVETPTIGDGIDKAMMALHWDGYGADHKKAEKQVSGKNLTDGGWHTFGVSWEPDSYRFYIDGDLVWTTQAGGVSDVKEFIRLTNELGWTSCPNSSDMPAYSYFDYVKVYKKIALKEHAEDFDAQYGTQTYSKGVAYTDDGDWIKFNNVDFGSGYRKLAARYTKGTTNSTWIEARLDSVTGTKIAEFDTDFSGGWNNYTVTNTTATAISGTHDLYMVFKGGSTVGNLDWFEFYDPAPVSSTNIKVFAAGKANTERLRLQIDGVTVETFNNLGGDADNAVFQTYSYDHPGAVSASQIKLVFDNDGSGKDVRVDKIEIDGIAWQTEAPSTYSKGSWRWADDCAEDYKESEWLHCPGYFAYDYGNNNRFAGSALATSLEIDNENDLLVYPNPVQDNKLFLDFTTGRAQTAFATCFDYSGKVISKKTFKLKKGLNKLNWEFSKKQKGLYLIRLETAEGFQERKIVFE